MPNARIRTALVLVAIFGSLLFWAPNGLWLIFVALVAAIGAWEWSNLVAVRGPGRVIFTSLMATLVLVLAPRTLGNQATAAVMAVFAASGAFWLLVIPFWLRSRWRIPQKFRGLALGTLVLLPAALALQFLRLAYGPGWLLAIMASVWLADIAAYYVGRRFGRVKLAPMISPGKTREGAWGAVAGVAIYAVVIAAASGRVPFGSSLAVGLPVAALVHTALSIMGDLFESLAKRQADVKDSGTILPGHGGVLDRIDSQTSTLPLVSLMAYLLVPPIT